jgi:hypothetical protein
MLSLRVGMILHGFCRGLFGRDHYGAWRVEAVGYDWVVVRRFSADDDVGELDFASTPGVDINKSFEESDLLEDNHG